MQTIFIQHPYQQPYYVYRVYAESGQLLYIGSSNQVETRLSYHSVNAHWFDWAHRVEIEEHPSEMAARVAEKAAILQELPLGNKKWTRRHRGKDPSQIDPFFTIGT